MDGEFLSDLDMPPPETVFKAIVITDPGRRKIDFIRLLRQVGGFELKTAKEIAERPTPFVLAACDEASAEAFRELASGVGATCELQDYDETMKPIIGNDQPLRLAGGGGQGGCASAMLLLTAIGGGLVYGLVLLF